MDYAERMQVLVASDLYVVITEAFCAGRTAVEVLEAVLDAGVTMVQLREKDLEDRALFSRAGVFREKTAVAGALLIVDDRLDVAMSVGADGVHLGQTDLPIACARAIAPSLLVGGSTHSLEEAQAAQSVGASYVNIGPIFATRTKAVSSGPIGVEIITAVSPHLRIPWTVMGGITAANIGGVLTRGARHVAVVTAVTASDDVGAAATTLRQMIAARHR